jgi:hypothetical protein
MVTSCPTSTVVPLEGLSIITLGPAPLLGQGRVQAKAATIKKPTTSQRCHRKYLPLFMAPSFDVILAHPTDAVN